MATLKDAAIVLRLVDWSETSQIAVLLTREHGKVSVTAKGSKRQTPSVMARFSGGLELLSTGEAVWMTKAGRDLGNLTEWDLVDGCWSVRQDLRAFDLAMYGVDLAHHMLHDHDPHADAFDALKMFLREPGGGEALLRYQWGLIGSCGYKPVLDRDAQTGGAIEDRQTMAFSARDGGLVTDNGNGDRWRVRLSTVALLRALDAGGALTEDAAALDRANRLLCSYCRAILDKELPTMRAVLGDDQGRG